MNSERGAVQQQLSGIDAGFVTRCATASGHIGDSPCSERGPNDETFTFPACTDSGWRLDTAFLKDGRHA